MQLTVFIKIRNYFGIVCHFGIFLPITPQGISYSKSVKMKRNEFFGIMFYLTILKEGQSSECGECSDFLVSGPRGISDDKLTASSTFPNKHNSLHHAKYGRLHFFKSEQPQAGAWSPATSNEQQYIQAEFSNVRFVKAIVTQGRANGDMWVTSYSISYSLDGTTWSTVKNVNKDMIIYSANNDRSTIVTNTLPQCIEAKYIRIHPKTWNLFVALRFDVIGCSTREPNILRLNVNWKKHPIILTSQIQQNLTQVFAISTQEINVCAVKCQQNSLCQTFSLNEKSGKCTGYVKQMYQTGIEGFSAHGDEAYFISLSQMEDREYDIVESLNLCYKIVTSKETAGSASAICKGEKARLLSVRNLDEMNIIKNSIRKSSILSHEVHLYIDGSYGNGQWRYATDMDIPASLWSPSHPLPGRGGCVTFTMNGLETHDCKDSLFFICGM